MVMPGSHYIGVTMHEDNLQTLRESRRFSVAPMKIVWFVSFDTNPFHTFSIGAAM